MSAVSRGQRDRRAPFCYRYAVPADIIYHVRSVLEAPVSSCSRFQVETFTLSESRLQFSRRSNCKDGAVRAQVADQRLAPATSSVHEAHELCRQRWPVEGSADVVRWTPSSRRWKLRPARHNTGVVNVTRWYAVVAAAPRYRPQMAISCSIVGVRVRCHQAAGDVPCPTPDVALQPGATKTVVRRRRSAGRRKYQYGDAGRSASISSSPRLSRRRSARGASRAFPVDGSRQTSADGGRRRSRTAAVAGQYRR